ncbi:ankyrin repeat domain-containing protein [Metabacillus fastidiosus]|uniref:ankyrin repeat domain-containing protein n=1 Tax=Metabacillus fastidiosus TaxID=1458 RepID=UPI002E1E9BCB|nr:ankyrin repeat domain-containing protein [Metabacillus fastidiosus]MED4531271.1 ankyrin repeat domain-containing protein [Metabacillus fastidiosus]
MNDDFNHLFYLTEIDELEEIKNILRKNPSLISGRDQYGFSILHAAVMTENEELVEYLIEMGADVNAKNNEGICPLHIVLDEGVAECLLNNGALIDAAANNGDTPLHTQVSEGEESIDVIQFLLERGAKTVMRNKFGETPLDIAESREENLIIKILRENRS